MTDLETVLLYHQRSCHLPGQYARGPGRLDWSTQPDPWRRYSGAPESLLPLRFGRPMEPASGLTLDSIAALLERSLGLSAWKQQLGSKWALRCNPSSGNLHPTEPWVVLAAHGQAGLYHYRSLEHLIERRCSFKEAFEFPVIGLTSIPWREAWKYGERAFRYCELDLGHALAALSYAAATIPLQPRLIDSLGDATLATLFGFDRAAEWQGVEREHPETLVAIGPPGASFIPGRIADLVDWARAGTWYGHPSRLSPSTRDWPIIDQTELATRRPSNAVEPARLETMEAPALSLVPPSILFQRRSAVDFTPDRGIDLDRFVSILDRVMPRREAPPWDVIPWSPRVHLIVFVHRVDGLAPGLYCLPRRPDARPLLEAAMHPEWEWSPVHGMPSHIPLLRLAEMETRTAAGFICCQQAIASDGAMAFAMLAEFEPVLRATGAWFYRRLFWECGAIGQALYLGAELAGVRATGIGCYYDELLHELIGNQTLAFRCLYHLAIGHPVEDQRITTLPPYDRRM